MRVTFFVVNYCPSVGGAQAHVQRVAEGLVARHGHHVEVVTTDALFNPAAPDPGRIERAEERIGGVRVIRRPLARRAQRLVRLVRWARLRLPGRGGTRRGSLGHGPLGLRLAFTAWKAARRSDVVVGVAAPYLTVAAADGTTKGTSTAHVVMPLLHLDSAELSPAVLRSLARADGCTASTDVERDWIVQRGARAERVEVLPPGCDPDRYPELDPSAARHAVGMPERLTVGYVGRLAAHKGIDTLLDAAPSLWAEWPDLTILVAGARAGWGGLDSRIAALDPVSGGRLVVREGFHDDERPLLLAACDVVVFPSREESFGMVTIEAWCARRPVVAADIDAVRSLIRTGQDGELIPVGDAAALAAEVGSLLGDPDRRRSFGEAGRARAEAEFTWDAIIDRWDAFLHGSVARRRGRSAT